MIEDFVRVSFLKKDRWSRYVSRYYKQIHRQSTIVHLLVFD